MAAEFVSGKALAAGSSQSKIHRRLAPHRSQSGFVSVLPPYTYVPGQSPHPVSDPRGHAYDHSAEPVPPLDPTHPEQSPAWCEAVALFEAGFYWEAHEAWESLWHAAGRTGPVADCLKGLIKWAAAGVKVREGRLEGVRRHCRRAAELFRSALMESGVSPIAGLASVQILSLLEAAQNSLPTAVGSPFDVHPIHGWTLR